MADNANLEKAPRASRLEGLKTEFKKIAWPSKESVAKQTVAVVAVSVVVGLIITILDTFIQYGIDILVNL